MHVLVSNSDRVSSKISRISLSIYRHQIPSPENPVIWIASIILKKISNTFILIQVYLAWFQMHQLSCFYGFPSSLVRIFRSLSSSVFGNDTSASFSVSGRDTSACFSVSGRDTSALCLLINYLYLISPQAQLLVVKVLKFSVHIIYFIGQAWLVLTLFVYIAAVIIVLKLCLYLTLHS